MTNQEYQERLKKLLEERDRIQSEYNANKSFIDVQNNNPSFLNKAGYVVKNIGLGAKRSVWDTVTALPQSYAVGLQRGAKQAEQEQNTWDKVKNFGKNYLKAVTYVDPVSHLLYTTTIGREDKNKEINQVATQIANNYANANSTWNKIAVVGGGLGKYTLQEVNSGAQNLYNSGQQVGQLIGADNSQKAIQGIQKFDDKLHEKTDKEAEELAEEGKKYGKFTNFMGEIGQTIGYMAPTILANVATGGGSEGIQTAGLVQMGLASKANTTREGLKQGLDLETAERRGVASGTIEVGTELMWSGAENFKKVKEAGNLEKYVRGKVNNLVTKNFKEGLSRTIASKIADWGVDVGGEVIEEVVSDIANNLIDRSTLDPNMSWKELIEQLGHTALSTLVSTTMTNAGQRVLGTAKIKAQEGIGEVLDKVYNRNQARVQNQESISETERTESNGYKENLQEMMNNLEIPDEIKAQIQPMLDSNATINAEEYKNITDEVKSLVKANTQQQILQVGNTLNQQYMNIDNQLAELNNIKPENFKDQESRKFYAQQINKEFSDNTINNILAMYPENRKGNRTVKQYKEIAKEYGKQMALNGLSFDEVRANTVGAWQYYEPNKNITRYDNKEKKNVSFDRLNSQVWSQEVYDSYRDTMKTQLQQQQEVLSTQMNDEVARLQDEEDILIDTIDNLKPKASPEQVARTKKLIEDFAKNRGVNVEYNAEVFKNSNEEGFIKDNGKGDRTIYINPNADPDTILVKLATHEMFHDTIRTEPHDKLTKLVMDKLKADENYNTYRESVREAYQEQLEGKTQAEQDAIIDEEMTAKYLGEYLGDEQFVQQLVNSTNRSTIQKIMDWIDNRLQQIKNVVTGNTEAEYWRKVRENFEKAYNSKYQGQEGTQYSKELENQESLFNMPTEDTKKSETIKAYEDFIDRYNQQFEKAKEIIQQQIPNLKMSNIINQKNSTSGSRIQITTPDGKKVFLYYEGGGEFVIGNGEKKALTNQKKGMIGGLEEVIDYIKSDILNENTRYQKQTSFDEALKQDNQGRKLKRLTPSKQKYLDKTNNNEKLKEREFYSLYSAHKIANTENAPNIIKAIQENGYKPSASSFGVDLTPSYHSYTDGKPSINDKYAPKKGDYVLFVPESEVRDDPYSIVPGFKPRDFEVVQVERDYQPYYELYEKAYDKYMENIEKQSNATTDNQGNKDNSKDLNISNGNARFSQDRLDYIVRGSVSDYGDNYARSYITRMTPQQFLDLTTTPEGLQQLESESTELNPEQLKNEQQNIFLRVDMETGKVLGHEGRHRMIALRNAGVNNVDIEIIPQQGTYDVENAKDFDYGLYLIGQSMNNGKKGKNVDFTNPITAVTKNNLDKIKQEYLNNNDNANDIRYSKKTEFDEALKENIETTNNGKNLLALHNLSEENLNNILDLGGFPVPSIAITNPNKVYHNEFGDYTVVFNKDTINPKATKKNEVYDRDVWSPTFPRIEYEANSDTIKNISKKLDIDKNYTEMDSIQKDALRDLSKNEVERWLENAGLDGLKDYIKDNKSIQYAYLKSQGLIEPSTKQVQFYKDYPNSILQEFLNEYKNSKLKDIPLNELSYEQTMDLSDMVKNLVKPYLTEQLSKYGDDGKAVIDQELDKFNNFNALNNFAYSANSMLNNGSNAVEIDKSATLDKIQQLLDKEAYDKWVDENITNEIIKDKGFDNGKERLTELGNRRSFKATHNEINLENLVKALSRGNTKGGQETSIFGTGFGRISAQTANRFKSIQDIKNNENRLMTREQATEIIQPLSDQLFEKVDKLADYYTRKDYGSDFVNHMQGTDVTSEIVEEFAGGQLSEERFRRILNEYNSYNTDKIPSKLLNGIINDLKAISNLPTDYFEAKPQRAVTFDEIDTIIIPSNASETTKQRLKDKGINFIEYDINNENARSDILKALDEYKFNKKAKAFDDYLKSNNPNRSGVTIGDLKNLPSQQKLPTKQTQLPTTKKTQTISSTIEEPTLKVPVPKGNTGTEQKVAKVLSEPITKVKPEQRAWALFKANILDKGAVFEDLSFKAKNRELQAKWDSTLLADAKGQNAIGQARYEFENGEEKQVSKALTDIIDEVGENSEDFNNYMYHQLNIDRMTLEDRFDIANKPVFGDGIDANYSRQKVAELEKAHPEFKEYAQDVYDYLDTNKKELVDNGVISQETSDRFKEMYPHYVPIARIDAKGLAINVPLDTNRTGVNSPIKRAKGGSQDIQPLFQTMADRTMQTYKASARNNFGIELKNTLNNLGMFNQLETTTENADNENLFEYDSEKGNLTEGNKYQNPTFTVFENGEKVTYEINQDMYDALRPKNEIFSKWDNTKLMKATRKLNDIRRGILTEYNPAFSITNAIKDAQDAFINSQHWSKTYAKFPEAYSQILKKGYWYKEYVQNGGSQNSYFTDGDFVKQDGKVKSIIKMPLEAISKVNNVIEMAPRLAEYIASREEGKSVQSSMLDASRVTTNFKAGGDVTKFANRNGATFLNASVQGLQQNIRNIREANAKGLKGYGILLGKAVIASLPALILNNLIWKDDDDYKDLQDYVKDNYYIIAKIGDHKFLRIPKGRTVAVIQKAVTNMSDFLTNKDEIDPDKYSEVIWGDLKDTFELASNNLAPNNPIENNIISPVVQAVNNKTWYGEDLVPSRLKDKPNEEKYDESTAEISKQISGVLNKIGINSNPMQINYLLDQYGGGVADVFLPMGTPQAENNMLEDKFTTDSVMKSRYPGEFFELKDKLAVNRNSSKATDEDELLYKYANNVSGELSDLYQKKREIQNSSLTDKEKKKQIAEVQKQINSKTQQALKDIKEPKVSGDTATIGNSEYIKTLNANSGEYQWNKLTDKTRIQGVSLKTQADYQNRLAKYKQKTGDSQLSDKEEAQIILDGNYSSKDKKAIYIATAGKKDTLYKSVSDNLNIDEYLNYKTANIQGVKDSNGKTISGTKKTAQLNYINENISGYENRLLLMGKDYKLSRSQQQDLAQYIYSQDNAEELFELFDKNFTVRDGTVYYK